MMRPTTDVRLMRHAFLESEQATCSRLHVGAILARNTRIIGSGWNGVPAGQPHCVHDGQEDRCMLSIHAEVNAIGYAAQEGIPTRGATLYATHNPCEKCAPAIVAAGIERVVYGTQYATLKGAIWLEDAGIKVSCLGAVW